MKFECGKRKRLKKAAEKQWHPYFAWHRIKLGFEDCRWMEFVERRKVLKMGDMYFCGSHVGHDYVEQWEYRASGQ